MINLAERNTRKMTEKDKLCPFTGLKEYCGNDCALYSEEYKGCCIPNFSEEIIKSLLKVLSISRLTRRN